MRTNKTYDCDYPWGYGFEDRFNYNKICSTNNPNAILHDQPHYTDSRFANAQVIYDTGESGKNGAYSDRMVEWDYDKHKKAWEAAYNSGIAKHTARYYEEYLSVYYDKKIKITKIYAGYNVATGYPYQYFEWNEE
jgi:hypothetical protein